MTTLKKLCLVILVLIVALSMVVRVAEAKKPAHAGSGHPPDHAREGKAVKADPDDNGSGPDRGDGTADLRDWNNGCGQEEDRQDDNEGWCGHKPKPPVIVIPPPEVPPIATVVERHNCTLKLYGRTPEVFNASIDVRNPANEVHVYAEANGYLEFHAAEGMELKILWYDPFWGHADSPITELTCIGTIVLWEPPIFEGIGEVQ